MPCGSGVFRRLQHSACQQQRSLSFSLEKVGEPPTSIAFVGGYPEDQFSVGGSEMGTHNGLPWSMEKGRFHL